MNIPTIFPFMCEYLSIIIRGNHVYNNPWISIIYGKLIRWL